MTTNPSPIALLAAVKAQLQAIEAAMQAQATSQTPDAKARMLAALEAGPKTVPQLQTELNLTKSAAHYAHLALASDGLIWIRKRPVPGKPGRWTNECYLAAHIATQ